KPRGAISTGPLRSGWNSSTVVAVPVSALTCNGAGMLTVSGAASALVINSCSSNVAPPATLTVRALNVISARTDEVSSDNSSNVAATKELGSQYNLLT